MPALQVVGFSAKRLACQDCNSKVAVIRCFDLLLVIYHAIIGIGIVLQSASYVLAMSESARPGSLIALRPAISVQFRCRVVSHILDLSSMLKHAGHTCTLNKTLIGQVLMLGGLKESNSAVNMP